MKMMRYSALAAAILAGSLGMANAYDGEQYVVCNLNPAGDNFLALRTCGATSCKMLRKLGPGTFVTSMEPYETKGWREIIVQSHIEDWSYAGISGWVYGKYICEIRY